MRDFKEVVRVFDESGGAEKLQQFTRDHEYIEERWRELLEEYPDKWVAVLRGEVIASADSDSALIKDIPKEDIGSTAIRFMDTDPKSQILIVV